MAKTVVALYDDFDTARSAVEALVDSGFDRGDISMVANDASGEYARHVNERAEVVDEDVSAGEGAGFGAVVGALVGLGVALIPGIGPVVAAGPLAAALMAGIGAASGAVTGGIVAGLVDFGVPEEHAEYYAEGVRRGGTLVTVHITQDEWADRAQSVLNRFNPTDVNERSGEWRSSGWTGYDENAQPLVADTMRNQNRSIGSFPTVGSESERNRSTDMTSASLNTPANVSQASVQNQSVGSAASTVAAAPSTTNEPYDYYEPRFRSNYDLNYVSSGDDYTAYDPAYRYGYTLATDPRYEGYDWARLEPEAERYWDKNYPGTWDRVRNAIRDAWDEVTGR